MVKDRIKLLVLDGKSLSEIATELKKTEKQILKQYEEAVSVIIAASDRLLAKEVLPENTPPENATPMVSVGKSVEEKRREGVAVMTPAMSERGDANRQRSLPRKVSNSIYKIREE